MKSSRTIAVVMEVSLGRSCRTTGPEARAFWSRNVVTLGLPEVDLSAVVAEVEEERGS